VTVPAADQLVIEEWTGAFDPVEHPAVYDQYGDGHLVALHILRARLATILCGPAQAAVDGDYSENYTGTINGLEQLIENLENVSEALGLDVTVGSRHTLTIGRVQLDEIRVP
jgi:hypothetical protein